jgi:hypothetical protein
VLSNDGFSLNLYTRASAASAFTLATTPIATTGHLALEHGRRCRAADRGEVGVGLLADRDQGRAPGRELELVAVRLPAVAGRRG